MGKKISVLLLIWALCFPAQALDASRYQTDLADLTQRVQSVRAHSFPDLAAQEIQIGTFSESDAYFQSNFQFWTLLTPKPVYVLQVNPALWERHCPPEAMTAILAHELSHTLDYVKGGLPGLIQIGWVELFPDSRAVYEHRTDLQAIFRGYAPGLIAYREWIYAQLNPEELARKKQTYYQPAEIRRIAQIWSELTPSERLALEQRWLAQPPMDLASIEKAASGLQP